jgi:hypothetical protein
MTLTVDEVTALAGLVPLAPAVADELPAATPAPTWRTRVEAVLWWHRAVTAAGAAAGAAPGGSLAGRRVSWVTVGAFVRYLDSPVGTYSEVFASPVLVAGRRGVPSVTVPFIAVDSIPSIHGGRAHWALPKVLASFEFSGSASSAEGALSRADGDDWSVSGRLTARGPRLPVAGVLPAIQPFPDGSARTSLVKQWGRMRPGRFEVAVTGSALQPWLLPGRHRCVEITGATMLVGPPS